MQLNELGLSLPLTAALTPKWEQAIADGHANDDVFSVFVESALPALPSEKITETSRL